MTPNPYDDWKTYWCTELRMSCRARQLSFADQLWDGDRKKWFIVGDYEMVDPAGQKRGVEQKTFERMFQESDRRIEDLPEGVTRMPFLRKVEDFIENVLGVVRG